MNSEDQLFFISIFKHVKMYELPIKLRRYIIVEEIESKSRLPEQFEIALR